MYTFPKRIALFTLAGVLGGLSAVAWAQDMEPPPSGAEADEALENSPRHGEFMTIPLEGSDTELETWLVYPERSDKAPVVIVIHEILGLTDWIRGVADHLAKQGFIAVAPNMISGMEGGNITGIVRSLSDEEIVKRLNAVRDWALELPAASGTSACVGYCWGGSSSFLYATAQPGLDAAVVYYGTAPDEEALAKIECPVLGHYGGDDARVTSTVEGTEAAMERLDKTYEAHVYDGAGHGFLRAQEGRDGANMKATEMSWPRTIEFFRQHTENE